MQTPWLFIYGSLRMSFKNEAYQYISEYFQFESMAKIKGILYDAGNHPVAKPSAGENYITGELYKIKDPLLFDWAIAQLDDYEGVCVEADEPQLYRRDLSELDFNGEKIEASVYWFNGDISKMPLLPMGDVMEYFKRKK